MTRNTRDRDVLLARAERTLRPQRLSADDAAVARAGPCGGPA